MRALLQISLAMITAFILHSCSIIGNKITINDIRIESVDISNVFLNNAHIDSMRARLVGSTFTITYQAQFNDSKLKSTFEEDFRTEDGLTYYNTKGISGTIYSVYRNAPLSKDDINELEENEYDQLFFLIRNNQEDDPFFNMVYIQGGQFTMGSREALDEIPIHLVKVKDFYIDNMR